jgi:hypothetical protein
MTVREALAQLDWPQDLSGVPVEDTGWLLASTYEQLLIVRAAFIESERKQDPAAAKWAEQTIGCLQMEEVPTEECPCLPPSGCKWFRTIQDVPEPIGDYTMITGVGGNLSNLTIYTYRPWNQIQYAFHSRIEAERTRSYWTKKNRKIYIAGQGHGEPIAVTGPFYDPPEIQRFPTCGEKVNDCKPFLDYNIYIDSASLNPILGGVVKNIVTMRSPSGYDNTNNANPPQGQEPVKQ